MSILILSEQELKKALSLDLESIACVEKAITALATKKVIMPPILSMEIAEANGEVDVKTAYVPGLDSFAVKISPGFFDNPKLGLPSLNGLMVLFSAKTGIVEAVLLDNGYLTDLRTACAGAVAAQALSRRDASKAAIYGTGLQARMQLEALCKVRPITKARIWGRNFDKAKALAASLSSELGIEVTASEHGKEAAKGSDIIVTTTPSQEPVLMADWLEPGQHITAMGSDADYKNELDPACLARADLYVADRISQTEKLGELRSALAAKTLSDTSSIPELSEVLAGTRPGREVEASITICDLTGMGVQDTAIAAFARERALDLKAGQTF
ncbi:ornithine cyclodeaminase [Cohaesibacter sp. ES.047]|uniref:ectoine utilization protein EutC n=1 Tax=Cohaesibacter sp. ES.047 TaxID=1798205 RepID=UPI000BB698C1|nr:ectoine utilization protein EutC [Cohaesibacter sp. ES.047]SNY92993.1 ornithine cyclodeaminase [Cohaesibacter sp. ES.047]